VKRFFLNTFAIIAFVLAPAQASVDDALSYALEAAVPHVKAGFTVREDWWGGDLPATKPNNVKAIVHQLFKGNEYWFWLGSDVPAAKLTVHVYDADGKLCEAEAWTKGRFAGARVSPKKTGTYYIIVEVEKSDRDRTHWAMAYGFR
jgi:hypothetical protein